jgi:hypothetical protein
MPKIATMKAYVGIAKAAPDSRTPRRLMKVTRAMRPTATPTLWSLTGSHAEATLATAAEIDTATVIT